MNIEYFCFFTVLKLKAWIWR